MANESERLFLSDFLKQYNIPVPDNDTPDSLFAAQVKKSLAILKGIDKDKINNESDLQQDLGLSIFDCLFFLADLERKFGIANKLLVNNLLGKPSEEGLSHYKDDTTIGTVGEIIAFISWLYLQDERYYQFSLRFNLHVIRRHLEKESEEKNLQTINYIKSIPHFNPTLEDLVFYQDYLSKFSLGDTLGELPLLFNKNEIYLTKADCEILLQLVAGSLSSTYQLNLNLEENALELAITSRVDTIELTKNLQELNGDQVRRLYRIYLQEQLALEVLRLDSEVEKKSIDETRNQNLKVFRQRIESLEKKLNVSHDRDKLNASLKELLNS